MALKTLMPVEEYLSADFDGPTPEYLDGELVERGMPTFTHSRTGFVIGKLIEAAAPTLVAAPELHVHLSEGRVRVMDVAVFETSREPRLGERVAFPPFIDIEVLSPDDRLDKIIERFAELMAWGVPHLWLVDPRHRQFYVFQHNTLLPVDAWELPQLGLRLTQAETFREVSSS